MRARWKTTAIVFAIILFCSSFSYSFFYRAAVFLGKGQGGVAEQPAALLDAKGAEDRRGQTAELSGRNLYLGITGGYVTVFDGPPGAGGSVLDITEIRADALPPPEVQDLIRGIRVSGPEELLMILEGLGGEGERE